MEAKFKIAKENWHGKTYSATFRRRKIAVVIHHYPLSRVVQVYKRGKHISTKTFRDRVSFYDYVESFFINRVDLNA